MILSSSIGKKLVMALTGLLLLIGIDMVLPATQAACRRPTTSAPLIAGPGTMSAIAC